MCADHHKGYAVPIGGVLASQETFSPSTVGFDIACGMKAVRIDATVADVQPRISTIMDDVVRRISFGVGRHNNSEVDHSLFDSDAWKLSCASPHKEMARRQLGTIGSGNHWTNIFADEKGQIWVGCHFGSRGLGHKIATWFFDQLGASDNMDAEPAMLHQRAPLGEEYLEAIELAGKYAYAGRDWVCDELARIIGAKQLEEVHSHHNFLWREKHGDLDYWVGRKGATPAWPGQRGLVGASMAEPSVIVEGVETSLSAELLYSTVHGAGRVMSRTAARGKINWKTGEVKSAGAVSPEMMNNWVNGASVELRGGGLDESPDCYKRLSEVLEHHEDSIKVVHTLKPLGVAMAGPETKDPYKD
jgi:tRNA-splicing ligase RtcB